jgi:proton-coupled amino acid transporter
MWEAAINLSKLCVGSGILALPFAAEKGGLLMLPVLIAISGLWNGLACELMINCKRACRLDTAPVGVTSTYSKIAYEAGGWPAVYLTDFCIVVTLLGVCVTYLITFMTLLKGIPHMPLESWQLAVLSAIVVYPNACSTDISKLTIVSFAGLVILLLAVCALVVFGIYYFGEDVAIDPWADLTLLPKTTDDFANAVGIAVFGFGLPSLAFPIEESMSQPKDFHKANRIAVAFVWIIYTLVAVGVCLLFVHDPRGISSNVLQNLPAHSFVAHIVRVLMATVCIFTFPLTFIPPAQMLERMAVNIFGRCFCCASSDSMCISFSHALQRATRVLFCCCCLRGRGRNEAVEGTYDHLGMSAHGPRGGEGDRIISTTPPLVSSKNSGDGSGSKLAALTAALEMDSEADSPVETIVPPSVKYLVRSALLVGCECAASFIPCFGLIVSLLGCFTVTILSFVIPPYLSFVMLSRPAREEEPRDVSAFFEYLRDLLLIIFGTFVCIASSCIVWQQCLDALDAGTC